MAPDSRRERRHLWILFLVASFVYGLNAVAKHARFMTSIDVGIFDQHLWRASHGLPLANTIREIGHLWGDHFHPLFLILTPLYWLGLGTTGLLIAQALLVCAGAFPLYRYGRARIAHGPMLLLTAAFLISWPIAEGLGFDVHDMALTVPALGWAMLAFAERRPWMFWIAIVALLLAREDQGLVVALFGVLALLRRTTGGRREWGLGAGLFLLGLGWTYAAIKSVIPHYAGGTYPQWQYAHLAPDAGALVILFVTHPQVLAKNLVTPFVKVALVRRFLEPGLFLALGSPWVLLAIPGVVSRLLTANPHYWEPALHSGFPTGMILAFAVTDTFGRALPLFRRAVRAPVARYAGIVLVVAGVFASALAPQKSLALPSFWRDTSVRAAGRAAIALIPPDVPVVATSNALAHLSERREIYVNWRFYQDHPQSWTRGKSSARNRSVRRTGGETGSSSILGRPIPKVPRS